jgi:zinc transport system ATP-binding protein
MKNILEVKNLTILFDKNTVIKNFSFVVSEGEFLTVLGPNGSGKTVLLKTLLGLISEYSGKVVWSKKAKVGYLPQGLTQVKVKDSPLSVLEFLSLKNKKKKEISEHLKSVGIKDDSFLKKRIGNLSGGQFQRMLMVWALFDNPNVLIFDEPTTGVDVGGEETVYALLKKLNKEKNITIILITHDINVVYKYSSDVLCMSPNNNCHAKPEEILNPEKLEELYGMPVKFYKHNH